MPGGLPYDDRVLLRGFLTNSSPSLSITSDETGETSDLARQAATINDSTQTDVVREAQLQKLFAEHGYTLAFEGEYLGGEIT